MNKSTRTPLVGGLALLIACGVASAASGSDDTKQALRTEILAQEKAFFDAFNSCDLATWKKYLSDDIEFYQDNDDFTTGREALERSFKARCGTNNVSTLRRELVPGTVEVHSIQGFGAVQFGTHRFWRVVPGKPDQLMSTPRFVHLWRNKDGRWQITRVISYEH